jgi:hypothetical protein
LSCCPQLCSSFTSKKIKKLGFELLAAALQLKKQQKTTKKKKGF